PATLTFLNDVSNDASSGITGANELLDALRNARGRDQAIIAAEARTLRAFYYYQLTDMFGGVPIFTTPQLAPQPRNTRAELFRFIETELLEARTALPNNWVAADYERMTKGAADAILASMYLNAAVFTVRLAECDHVQLVCQRARGSPDRVPCRYRRRRPHPQLRSVQSGGRLALELRSRQLRVAGEHPGRQEPEPARLGTQFRDADAALQPVDPHPMERLRGLGRDVPRFRCGRPASGDFPRRTAGQSGQRRFKQAGGPHLILMSIP